ncbi:hypothetical protein CIPAW_03G132100 [Carya illinoinensis]|uniref:Uncharacterized protein n=1 Tax=Carya illinoinensis TaxID=32201 RepID=A0A8T1R3V2_CARIL|nr:hypothetical protein CIPAW_03G132100 [Carya illinoinensis]
MLNITKEPLKLIHSPNVIPVKISYHTKKAEIHEFQQQMKSAKSKRNIFQNRKIYNRNIKKRSIANKRSRIVQFQNRSSMLRQYYITELQTSFRYSKNRNPQIPTQIKTTTETTKKKVK